MGLVIEVWVSLMNVSQHELKSKLIEPLGLIRFVYSETPVLDPDNNYQYKNILYAGIWPIEEFKKGHVTDVIGWIPA